MFHVYALLEDLFSFVLYLENLHKSVSMSAEKLFTKLVGVVYPIKTIEVIKIKSSKVN